MNRSDDARDAHLATGAYVLHALDADERSAVEAAAARSEELSGELAELTDTAVLLGLAVPQEAPPPALRARLLDAIGALPQQPALETETDEDPPSTLTTGAHVASGRRRIRRRPAVLIAVTAVAALLFGGGLLVDRAVVGPQTEYAAIISASDALSSNASVKGGGEATVTWSPSQHATAVVLHGVSAPSGRVLQLWNMRGTTITSAGFYAAGASFQLLSGTPASGEKLGVSIEPTAGSAHPTKVISVVPLT